MRMDDNADAKRILLASPPADWRRQSGRPRITWLSTVQQDLKQHHLTLPEAADLAQNRHLRRMMSTYGVTQSWVACQKRRRRRMSAEEQQKDSEIMMNVPRPWVAYVPRTAAFDCSTRFIRCLYEAEAQFCALSSRAARTRESVDVVHWSHYLITVLTRRRDEALVMSYNIMLVIAFTWRANVCLAIDFEIQKLQLNFWFLSRVSVLTRDTDIAILSVRLSVRNVLVLDENFLTYRHSFFHRR